MSIFELIGAVSGLAALAAALIAIWLDVKIIHDLDPHHEMIRDLHHHHFGGKVYNSVGHDTGLHVEFSDQSGHEDCCGPVYRHDEFECDPRGSECPTPTRWND